MKLGVLVALFGVFLLDPIVAVCVLGFVMAVRDQRPFA